MEKYRSIPQGYLTVGKMAKRAGVTVRALQHYDAKGLLSPSSSSEGGFRLYTDKDMEKLWRILLLRELGYKLKSIKEIMDSPDFDMRNSIGKHIELLVQKKERLESLIVYANIIKMTGIIPFYSDVLDYMTFDELLGLFKLDDPEYKLMKTLQGAIEKVLSQPNRVWSKDEKREIYEGLSSIFNWDKLAAMNDYIDELVRLNGKDLNSKEVRGCVKKLYGHFCTVSCFDHPEAIIAFLVYGQTLASGGDIGTFSMKHYGEDATSFIANAIQVYCDNFMIEQQ